MSQGSVENIEIRNAEHQQTESNQIKNKLTDRATSSQLWKGSFYTKAWFSYAIIGVSCATALLFVFFASMDESRSGKQRTSVSQMLQSNGERSESIVESAELAIADNEEESGFIEIETTPIQQAVLEQPADDLQPSGIEFTSGGDLTSEFPVRLLGVIHVVEEEPADADLPVFPTIESEAEEPANVEAFRQLFE